MIVKYFGKTFFDIVLMSSFLIFCPPILAFISAVYNNGAIIIVVFEWWFSISIIPAAFINRNLL